MENKDNYTSEEIASMISAVREYDLYKDNYIKMHVYTITWEAENKNRIEFRGLAKEKFDKSLENCKATIPKSLINKLEIKNIEINKSNGKLEFKDIE